MFTGIIQSTGEIVLIKKISSNTKISVKSRDISMTANIGDSIAINGVCLTIVANENHIMTFDVSDETINSSNIGSLQSGSKVNLEPAMMVSDRFGGHIVSGHVDDTGTVKSITKAGNSITYEISASNKILRYLVNKGSIAVDGISLTVANVFDNGFSVIIIPHTAKITSLGIKKVGDIVNLESDIIGKYVERILTPTIVAKIQDNNNKQNDSSLLNTLKTGGYL